RGGNDSGSGETAGARGGARIPDSADLLMRADPVAACPGGVACAGHAECGGTQVPPCLRGADGVAGGPRRRAFRRRRAPITLTTLRHLTISGHSLDLGSTRSTVSGDPISAPWR